MKKITIIFTSFLLLLLSICIAGCTKEGEIEKVEYDKVPLTTQNYEKYIAINVELTDYNLIKLDEYYTVDKYYYTASVIVSISTSNKKPNCLFEDVVIKYTYPIGLTWDIGTGIIAPTAALDYAGASRCSYSAMKEHCLIDLLATSQLSIAKVTSIEGYVLVPKE